MEKYIDNVIVPKIEYPAVSYEAGQTGMGIISIKRINNYTTINLVKGIDPFIDGEVLENMTLLKDFLSDCIIPDLSFYVPYEFKIGDESVRSTSSINVIYPGDKAEMLLKDSIKLFLFKSEVDFAKPEIISIDNNLFKKFDEYIKEQKGGMIGFTIVNKKEYKEYLKKERNKLIKYNRSYYCKLNANNERILEIVLAKDGFCGTDVIEYDLLKNRINRYYKNVTY